LLKQLLTHSPLSSRLDKFDRSSRELGARQRGAAQTTFRAFGGSLFILAAASCGCFDLEDKNLYMLANSKGNILDDAELIATLKALM
jgi:hypothetical protein